MTAASGRQPLSDLSQRALDYYKTELEDDLLPLHCGKSIAIHVDSGDYEIADTYRDAAEQLLRRHAQDGRMVTLRIGPPTDSDIRLASRIVAAEKR